MHASAINVKSSSQIRRFCKRCNQEQTFRYVKSDNFHTCVVCAEHNTRKHRKKHWLRYLAQKANARKRQDSEKMTEELLQILMLEQGSKCALSGMKFDIEDKWLKPSLDRIDNTKGYTKNNVRLITWGLNHVRGDLSDKELVDLVAPMVDMWRA